MAKKPTKKEIEQQKLIDTLKFTPRTYKVQMWGYGGEIAMGTVDRKIYDYFKHRRLDVSDFAWSEDYAEEHGIPEEMYPFYPGSWYDCDDMAHVNGVSRNAGTLQVEDENGEVVYERRLEDLDGSEDSPEWSIGEEAWIGSRDPGTVVFVGRSNEKGTFFEADLPLTAPFDITKMTLNYDEVDGEEIVNSVNYDGEDLDNWGGSTDGKSSDFGFYLVKDSNTWESYLNMDSIEYALTDWFPKKTLPELPGNYMIKTPGRNSYEHQARWTGSRWINSWGEDTEETETLKVKEWRGLVNDPDDETVAGVFPYPTEARLVEFKEEEFTKVEITDELQDFFQEALGNKAKK
jgi:hypothetical protein